MDSKTKEKKKESLEDIIVLFVIYVCTDLLCLVVITFNPFIKIDEVKWFDSLRQWLEKYGSKLSRGLNYSTEVLVAWRAYSCPQEQLYTDHNFNKNAAYNKPTCSLSFVSENQVYHTTKSSKIDNDCHYILVAVIIFYLQYTSSTFTKTLYNAADVLDMKSSGVGDMLTIDLANHNLHSFSFAESFVDVQPTFLPNSTIKSFHSVSLHEDHMSPIAMLIMSPMVSGEKSVNARSRRSIQLVKTLIVELKGSPNTGYCVEMAFGQQEGEQQEFCMLVDTGSSNLAVAAKKFPEIEHYYSSDTWSSTLEHTGQTSTVQYTVGQWSGDLVRDFVSIGRSPPVDTEFTMITASSGFFISGAEWSGILGLAYDSLAKPDSSIKSFWTNLQHQSQINDLFVLHFCPHINFINQGGILEFGSVSENLYTGPIHYTSIVKEMYYNVLVTNLTVGEIPINMPCSEFNNDKAIVDSGTTDIYLPTKVFNAVVQAFSQHIQENVPLEVPPSFWQGGSKISWPTESRHLLFEAFPILYIGFSYHDQSSSEFSLAVTSQVYLRQVPGSIEEQQATNCFPLCDFFVFGVKPRTKGLVIGGNLLTGFTTVFDREKQRVGFAKSTCHYADNTYGHVPFITGPYDRAPVDCTCYGCTAQYWEVIVYTCGSIVFFVGILTILCKLIFKLKNKEPICGLTRLKCSQKCHFCCNHKCTGRRGNIGQAESEQLVEEENEVFSEPYLTSSLDSGYYDDSSTDSANEKLLEDEECDSHQETGEECTDAIIMPAPGASSGTGVLVGTEIISSNAKIYRETAPNIGSLDTVRLTRAPNIYNPRNKTNLVTVLATICESFIAAVHFC